MTQRAGASRVGRRAVVGLVAAAAVLGSVTGVALSHAHAGGTTPTAGASVTRTTTSAVVSSTPAARTPVPPAPGTSSAALVALRLTDTVRAQLVAAYVRDHGYQASWITGTVPGSVYYLLDPSTGDHLALAGFVPAAGAPQQVLVGLQDAGAATAFRQVPGGTWQVYPVCTTPAFAALVAPLPAGAHC